MKRWILVITILIAGVVFTYNRGRSSDDNKPVKNKIVENWPSWRGLRHDGTSMEIGLPEKWSKTENVKWRLSLPGASPATPAIWGDRIFLTSAEGESSIVLMCVNTSGEVIWKKTIDDGNFDVREGEGNAAGPSPSVDGEHIWVFLGTGKLACYDFNGKEIWSFNVQDRYKKFNLFWGMMSTPVLDNNKLYIQLLHSNAQFVVALDKMTGREIWRFDRESNAVYESRHSYTTPFVYRFDGEEFLLTHGSDYIVAHDLEDGSEIWRCGGLQNPKDYNKFFRFVASPVAIPGLIVVPSAKNGPVLGLNPKGAKGDITLSEKNYHWKREDNTPDVPSPVIYDGLVYLCRENGVLLCLDAKTGEQYYLASAYRKRHRASPVYADGKIYLTARDGTITVVKAGKEFEIIAQNTFGEVTAASPAISDGTMYVRTYKALYAIGKN